MNKFEMLCRYCEVNNQQFHVFYNCVHKEYEVAIPHSPKHIQCSAKTLDEASMFAIHSLQNEMAKEGKFIVNFF